MPSSDRSPLEAAAILEQVLGASLAETAGARLVSETTVDPLGSWAASGGLWLTGRPGRPPLAGPAGAGVLAQALLDAVERLSGRRTTCTSPALPGVRLLGERAAVMGLHRGGAVSCGGATRLMATADGVLALTLARPSDLAMVPALVGRDVDDPWPAVTCWAQATTTAEAAARARLLDLPVAPLGEVRDVAGPAIRHTPGGRTGQRNERPLVVDLSALWAGPLCSRLLRAAGAEVVKVEDVARPDGARRGSRAFYDLLHHGHRSVGLDFGDERHRRALRGLVEQADVIIEGSRPHALERLGLDASARADAGGVWVSITGYGRGPEGRRLVGFGDDVAASAGLTGADRDGPVFCGDALADPLTGLAAAVAALAVLRTERGAVLDVAMHRVCHVAASVPPVAAEVVGDDSSGWWVDDGTRRLAVSAPTCDPPAGEAAPLGRDTADVLGSRLSRG